MEGVLGGVTWEIELDAESIYKKRKCAKNAQVELFGKTELPRNSDSWTIVLSVTSYILVLFIFLEFHLSDRWIGVSHNVSHAHLLEFTCSIKVSVRY